MNRGVEKYAVPTTEKRNLATPIDVSTDTLATHLTFQRAILSNLLRWDFPRRPVRQLCAGPAVEE